MTAFGVFWGLLMLILLVGFGHGIFNGIVGQLNYIPSNSMFIFGGSTTMSHKGFGRGRYFQMDDVDLALLRTNLGERAQYVSPLCIEWSRSFSVGENKCSGNVIGAQPVYQNVEPQKLLYGRYINDIDLYEHRTVCVIGLQTYESLFPAGTDPTGLLIREGGIYYTIVGVVKTLSNMMRIGNVNRSVIIPITTMQQTYHRGKNIDLISLTLHDQYPIDKWEDRIVGYCKEHHMVHPDDDGAFNSINIAEILNTFKNLFLGINILLWIVGCGSLLAGLIGISNIMLVTVKERTQEIGVRRALGAKPVTILSQIMAESLVLTSVAGVAGLMLGVWILALVDTILKAQPPSSDGFSMQNPQIPFHVAIAAMLVIIIGGLWAGWIPAKRAMKIRAIEALREE